MSSGILYAQVIRGSTPLAEWTKKNCNFSNSSRRILENIDRNAERDVILHGSDLYFILNKNSLIYLCVTDDKFTRRIAYSFLEDISESFFAAYGSRALTAHSLQFNEFSKTMERRAEYFSSNPAADKITKVKGEVEEVKDVLVDNLNKAIDRSSQLTDVSQKAGALKEDAASFRRTSRQVKNQLWYKNVKLMLLIFGAVALLIFFIAALACGGMHFPNCRAK